MKKITFIILITFGFSQVAKSKPLDLQKYVQQQGWTEAAVKRKLASPVSGIVPFMYFSKDSSVPSCALLVETSTEPTLIELSGPEQGETYPQCLGINDVANFRVGTRDYVVFEYLSRETREDSFSRFY